MRKTMIVMCAAGLAGCAAIYQAPASKPTAEFQLASTNDSSGTTSRSIQAWIWKNEECEQSEYGRRSGFKNTNDASIYLDPLRIVAGEKFVFTANYTDARFAQNRRCAITASFMPVAEHRYFALFLVGNDGLSCEVGVYDTTSGKNEKVPFSMPPHLCDGGGKSDRANGQPLTTNWVITNRSGTYTIFDPHGAAR